MVYQHPSAAALLRELRRDGELRAACGFNRLAGTGAVPTGLAFSRFLGKVIAHEADIQRMFETLVEGVAVDGAEVTFLPLNIAGLMSSDPVATVVERHRALRTALGRMRGRPALFIKMSFLALPVIPELRITNRGLVDVGAFDFVPEC